MVSIATPFASSAVPLVTFPTVLDETALASKMDASHVNFFYGPYQTLFDVSLGVPKNQITALIGPSGCGKSTFLRLFNRMNDEIPKTRLEGSITMDGQDIYRAGVDPVILRTRVGMVYQRANPLPKSIFDNVVYGPRIHGVRNRAALEEIAEKSLKQAALWEEVKDKLKMSALKLSGGQQQRLCVARALAVEPEVLLLDEPTAALDPNATRKIEDLLVELKGHYTFILVTHNMHQAQRVADRTAFFLSGQLIEVGATSQVFSQPHDSRTEDYVRGRFG